MRFPSPAVAESLKMGVYGKVSATGLCLGDVGKQTNSVGKVICLKRRGQNMVYLELSTLKKQ